MIREQFVEEIRKNYPDPNITPSLTKLTWNNTAKKIISLAGWDFLPEKQLGKSFSVGDLTINVLELS